MIYNSAEKKMEEQKWSNKNSNFMNFPDDHQKQDLDEQTRQRAEAGKANDRIRSDEL